MEELKHYGVLGMKWGVRKQNRLASKTEAKAKLYDDKAKDYAKRKPYRLSSSRIGALTVTTTNKEMAKIYKHRRNEFLKRVNDIKSVDLTKKSAGKDLKNASRGYKYSTKNELKDAKIDNFMYLYNTIGSLMMIDTGYTFVKTKLHI